MHPWVAESSQGPMRFGIQAILGQDDRVYRRAIETAQLAESLGFDFFSIFDHPLMQADPWTCLPAVAMVTERIRLGSTVNCGLYRHPAHLARLTADLDGISGGRAILGLGSGWLEREFKALEVPFGTAKDRQDALDEAVQIVVGCWGDQPFTFEGKHFSTFDFQTLPPPVQRPRPPIMIGGSGVKRTLRQVAQWADACNINEEIAAVDGYFEVGERAESVGKKLAALDQHCDDLGRPREEILRTHFTLSLIVGESSAAARRKYDAFDPSLSSSPGTRRAGKGGILTGSVEAVIEYYQAMADAGIQYFVVQLEARDQETIELLGREVMPRITRPSA
jgi:alkanesulfonate monooxygenase SsuD/methylene tetrahydromethanopterin reductase-like flavin-dependent oxidoreductase (luciferase family)